MNKFDYDNNIPVEVIQGIKEYLDPLEFVIPNWCEYVTVYWDAYQVDAVVTSNIDYEYRRGRLTFGPAYLEQTHSEKQKILLHDLLHLFLAVLHHFACDLIDECFTKPEEIKIKTLYHKILKERNESVTSDLTTLFKSRIYVDKK